MQNNLLVVLSVGILSSLLLTTSVTNNNSQPNYFRDPTVQTLPYYEWFYKVYAPQQAYAQDEDEEEEEDEEKEAKEDEEDEESEEESSSNGKDEEQESEEEGSPIAEPLEQISNTWLEIEQQKEQIEQTESAVKEDITSLLQNNDSWINPVTTEEQQDQQQQIETTSPPPQTTVTLEKGQYLDPQCDCITTTPPTPTSPEPEPIFNLTNDQIFVYPTPQQQQQQSAPVTEPLEQIIIKDRLKSFKVAGQIIDPEYTNFFHSQKMYDNILDNETSFWSQAGPAASSVLLTHPIQSHEVCAVEIYTAKPNNAPYKIDVGSKSVTGILDHKLESIKFEQDGCVKNVNQITFSVNAPNEVYTSIGEIKLFGKKVVSSTTPPQTIIKPTIPTTNDDDNVTKIDISNSNAEISIQNSTVTFKFDPESAKATGYNVITIPNAEVVN